MNKKTSYSVEIMECRALAFYYEQAVLEHAYRLAGESDKADSFAERMREYETQLGSLSSKTADAQKAAKGDVSMEGEVAQNAATE